MSKKTTTSFFTCWWQGIKTLVLEITLIIVYETPDVHVLSLPTIALTLHATFEFKNHFPQTALISQPLPGK